MSAKYRLKAFFRAVALLMLFITFFANFLFQQVDILTAFIRAVISYVVSIFILNFLFMLWRAAFSDLEWKWIVDGQAPGNPKPARAKA